MNNTTLDLTFPAIGGKEVVARNDGGDITSDAGLLLVSLADKKIGLTEAMAHAIKDPRRQSKVDHDIIDMVRERIYAICQDYEDANDLDSLRSDPALKSACGRLPKSGKALASQPTFLPVREHAGRQGYGSDGGVDGGKSHISASREDPQGYYRRRPDRRSLSWTAGV